MKKTCIRFGATAVIFLVILSGSFSALQAKKPRANTAPEVLSGMHSISSHELFGYVKELCSKKYGGRLTGTAGYNAAARWTSECLKKMGIKPAGENHSYLQAFPNPYTLVLEGSEAILHIPITHNQTLLKPYIYEKDFIPGSTSDSGEVTAEVIYVGYGITAPELGFDEYKGIDVKGKIVLMEREVPVSPEKEPVEFKKWRKYSFHQYKVRNARDHGAAGMLYNYHIANPNCQFITNFILTYAGPAMIDDLFLGTGKTLDQVKKKIQSSRAPKSFSTGKVMTIKNHTEHYPNGIAANVIGILEGKDQKLKGEAIIIGAHLDHVGCNHMLMPGANDNASGVAVVLGVAHALSRLSFSLKRSIIFILFGAEEQGVVGSQFYLQHPVLPNTKIMAFINMDGVGRGKKIWALAAQNFPEIWDYFKKTNKQWIHREISTEYFHNLARPRLDAARFMWAGIPTISFSTYGETELPHSIYHKTLDTPDIITPEIMEDLAQLIFASVIKMAEVM
jgi:hypothetical protein